MRAAEARRAASTITSNSMRFSDDGGHVGCTMNVSRPRIFSRISTLISPSLKNARRGPVASGTSQVTRNIEGETAGARYPRISAMVAEIHFLPPFRF